MSSNASIGPKLCQLKKIMCKITSSLNWFSRHPDSSLVVHQIHMEKICAKNIMCVLCTYMLIKWSRVLCKRATLLTNTALFCSISSCFSHFVVTFSSRSFFDSCHYFYIVFRCQHSNRTTQGHAPGTQQRGVFRSRGPSLPSISLPTL